MQYSQKYTIVAFLEPVDVGTKFAMTDWPLHVTLADVFAVELASDLEAHLTKVFLEQAVITVSAGEDATLGTADVVLINKSDKLQALHDQLIDLLESEGAVFNSPQYTRGGFLPHSTIQKSGRMNKYDEFDVRMISLVDMFVRGDWQQRKVLANFTLSEN